MYIIVGLGNPGNKYKGTKHNIGFEVIDRLSSEYNISLNKIKFKSIYGEINIDGEKVILMKPQTFMNNSGEAVREIQSYFKIPIENIIVIQDDIDLDIGKLRLRRKGSAGSHNGLKSIIYLLKDDRFPRVKIGVGRQREGQNLADYVLSGFRKEDIETVEIAIERAADAVVSIVADGIDKAMNKFNS
ncbi:MAG: aminoacyl-tRNA hydrolase [Andreesenia angusta]|nr:aminoacyl-tRNA hydrolase [Andreesenia angusta]